MTNIDKWPPDDDWPRSQSDHWDEYEGMHHEDISWSDIESDLEAEYEAFWTEVVDYATELGLPIAYIEEEFVIFGELLKHK